MSNPPRKTSDDDAARGASVARDALTPGRSRRAAQFGWVASAALAAVVEWWIVQPRYPFFVAPASPVAPSAPSGPGAHPPNDVEIAAAARLASMNIAALVGLAGATIGAALSLANALPGASVKRASGTILAGGILGGASGFVGGWCSQWLSNLVPVLELDETQRTFLLQTVCWGTTGLGVGLALAMPFVRPRRRVAHALMRGALGGILGALVYPIASAVVGIVLPVGDTPGVVPEMSANRFIWLEATAVAMAVSLAGGSSRKSADWLPLADVKPSGPG